MMKKLTLTSILALALIAQSGTAALVVHADDDHGQHDQVAEARAAGSTLEIHVSDSGKVLVRGAKVTGVTSSTVNASITWGSASFVWAVVTDGRTEFVRRFGGASSVSEISAGDFISFQGTLNTGVSSPLTVNATVVKDWSIQKKHASFYGTVASVNADAKSFVINTEERGSLTVTVSSGIQIMKGGGIGAFADITVGAKVTVAGLWNTMTNTLEADSVKVHTPGVVRTTLEGSVKSINPLVLTSGDKDYVVNISSDTSVINTLWLRLPVANVRVGDTVRVYGAINTNGTVDATVVRDTSIRL